MAAVTFLRRCRHFVRSPRAILTQPGKRIWLLEGRAVNTNRRLPLPLPLSPPLRLRCPLKAIDWLEAVLNHDGARQPSSQRPTPHPFPRCPANELARKMQSLFGPIVTEHHRVTQRKEPALHKPRYGAARWPWPPCRCLFIGPPSSPSLR